MAEAAPAQDVAGDNDAGSRPQRPKKAPAKYEPSAAEGSKKPRKRKAPAEKASKKAMKSSSGKKGKKSKKKSTGPKRAKSAFIYFTNENRDDVKRETPSLAFGEVAKALGKMWKQLPAAQKKKYEDMAAKDKKRYEKEKNDMDGSGGGDAGDDEPQDVDMPADDGMGDDVGGYE